MKRLGMGTLRVAAMLLAVLLLVVGLPACKRNTSGQLPTAGGEAIVAQRAALTGFAASAVLSTRSSRAQMRASR